MHPLAMLVKPKPRGKGVHPAALNFGDCFAFEVATEHRCRLLYVGEGFVRTDIEGAF
jgi:ribonuclease VapC